ncbi:AMP-binding protein [Tropicibacter oceani]|uniref:AMP-binding protein n=1 Tax=Tropicibacter oceani TaxID=3058420 RepID=A0ABY8QJ16_9RHOB|nr:AMP-binding protein [Tropicibacter oceani]WGW04510.1 AMP-binding protein [Tropicibacter oceani]
MALTLASRFKTLIDLCQTRSGQTALIGVRDSLSYAGLGRRTQAIYHALSTAPQGMVLIHGHKEMDVVPAMMAATFAGRGFVFADISYPAGRVAQIIQTCNCGVVLRTDPKALQTDLFTIDTGRLSDRILEDLRLDPKDEEALFYVTFTSGSTGVPKGIPTTRASYAALSDWFEPENTGSAGGTDAHVSHASMAFDMSMSDIWTALFAGRSLYLLDHTNTLSPRANIHQLLSHPKAPAGTLTATPAFFALMLEDPKFNAQTLPRLRAFWIGGEAVQRSLLLRLRDRFPGCEIHHAYGPSECACITHSHILSDAALAGTGPLPLGPEQSGCRVLVDTGKGFALTGQGEIVLVGPQVGTCYWPLDHPNNANFGMVQGMRSYRTGDHGEVDETGSLKIHGRIDNQVKVNGFRIELGEIERSAVQVDGIRQAVALQADESSPTRGLILVLNGDGLDQGADKIGHVRDHLRATLPPFMMPAKIVIAPDLPMSHSGKIDRRAMKERFGTA